jgi:hypothetical protein
MYRKSGNLEQRKDIEKATETDTARDDENRKRYKKEEEVEDDEECEEGLLGQFSRQTDEAVKVKEQVKMVFKLRR